MEVDRMTQTEFYVFLLTLAENIRCKAQTAEDAAAIVEEKAKAIKPQ